MARDALTVGHIMPIGDVMMEFADFALRDALFEVLLGEKFVVSVCSCLFRTDISELATSA